MIASLVHFEDRFLSNFSGIHLPPTWNVIYQEGIRANHVLFNENDLPRFEAESKEDYSCLKSNSNDFEDIAIQLMTSPSLTSMQEVIAQCDYPTRRSLFLFYKRLIAFWTITLKKNLH